MDGVVKRAKLEQAAPTALDLGRAKLEQAAALDLGRAKLEQAAAPTLGLALPVDDDPSVLRG
jgi:hypothetical protein